MNLWLLRVIWITMPVTAGAAVADAVAPWSDAPRLTAAVLLWVGWTVVLLATLIPRPIALTITRVALPIAFVVAVAAAASGRPPTLVAVAAMAVTLTAFGLGTRGDFARRCAQGAAYGDEDRFPLKVPPGLFLGILPFAIAVVGAAVVLGPLLLANREWAAGIVVFAVCGGASVMVLRLVHQLSLRWVVLVPAGMVIADPLTLTDPVLFPRPGIVGFGPADPSRRPPEDACDLRLGASFGSCALLLAEETDLMRRQRTRGVAVRASLVLVTPTAAPLLLERARARRIHVRAD